MHLTQQQQLNHHHHQMCPPPLGPPTAWFMNPHPQSSTIPSPSPVTAYHHHHHHPSYNQHYYNGSIHPVSLHNVTSAPIATLNGVGNSGLQQQNHQQQLQHPPLQPIHQQSRPPSQNQTQQQYGYPYHLSAQQSQRPQHQSSSLPSQPLQQQQQQPHQQQYNSQLHHPPQQLDVQQSQSQLLHVHQQSQHSPHQPQPPQQQQQPQLSPHPRPSPTLHLHQQPSPSYQQHSPLNRHLTSPSLQPSPVLHHPSQSPLSRHQQPTPPHHTPTPNSQIHNSQSRPASVKESSSSVPSTQYLSNILQTEVRVLEINRRLQCRPACHRSNPLPNYDQYDEGAWWEEFMTDFFKDDATLCLYLQVDDRPVRYVLRRNFISRFFKSFFDGGVTELSIHLRNSKEVRGQQVVVLDCEQANITTKNILKHPKVNSAPKVIVCNEGHLSLEFVSNGLDSLLIRSWKFKMNVSREYIDRSITAIGLPNTVLADPITIQGLPSSTMFYLRMCSIMEPMQELMSQHKVSNIDARSCLKQLLLDKYRYRSDDEIQVASVKKRKRKSANSISSPISDLNPSINKRSKAPMNSSNNLVNNGTPSTLNLPLLNVMIVGEPSSMGAEYRDDNERSISKVDNLNYASPVEPPKSDSSSDGLSIQRGDEIKNELDTVEQIDEEITQPLDSGILKGMTESTEDKPHQLVSTADSEKFKCPTDEKSQTPSEELPRQISEEPFEKDENTTVVIDESHVMNSTATQIDGHFNIMNSIPEDREDNCRSTSCDSIVSKLPPSSNNKNTLTSNGSSNKQNRRRSSERKETLREGLMRIADFVVALKDLKCEHPSLWRITSGNNLLQQFEPKVQNGVILYENTNQYAGWNPEIKKDYVGVDVKLTQHTRNQITVEKLHLNFQTLENANHFYDKHTSTYLQILVSTVLDPAFWETIENEPKHHDYFLSSRRIIEDITKRLKVKLATKLKLSEVFLKNVEKYPNLLIKTADREEKEQLCRACNTNLSTQVVTFGNRSYDLHSYQPVKVTSELSRSSDDRDLNSSLCESCLEIVKLYSDIHHMGWKLYNLAKEKIEPIQAKGKRIHDILDECINDVNWMQSIYDLRDRLWSRVESIE